MSGKFIRSDSVFVQQGGSNTLRVANETLFNVVKEEWEGSTLLNTFIWQIWRASEVERQRRKLTKRAVQENNADSGLATRRRTASQKENPK